MNDGLVDAFRYSAWANRELLRFCRGLPESQLRIAVPGGYGSILETFKHLIGSESFYRYLFAGDFLRWNWHEEGLPSLDELEGWAADLAAFWEELLTYPLDADAALDQTTPDGSEHHERAGIVVTQALHHANVHREQVNATLTSFGVVPPDLDVWVYGRTTMTR